MNRAGLIADLIYGLISARPSVSERRMIPRR